LLETEPRFAGTPGRRDDRGRVDLAIKLDGDARQHRCTLRPGASYRDRKPVPRGSDQKLDERGAEAIASISAVLRNDYRIGPCMPTHPGPESVLRGESGAIVIRVGTDLVSVEAVREALEAHGSRYLTRVYTERELEDCRTGGTVDPERLAARFAAKEATIKLLRGGDASVPWRSIEVRRDPAGWVDLLLSGPAATLAETAGIRDLSLSVSHDGGFASAVVVAELQGNGDG
jgi:holo-[acyl-carrier protein] synthase